MALCVLTDRSLVAAAAAFSTGVPLAARALRQRLKCTLHPKTSAPAPEDVTLWQLAVRAGDTRTLLALKALAEVPALRPTLSRVLDGVVGFALTHARDAAMRAWVYATFPAFRELSFEHFGALGAHGDVEAVEFAVARGLCDAASPRQFGRIAYEAAKAGHLSLVVFAHKRGNTVFSKAIMDVAATNGHMDVVRFLHENRSEGCTRQALSGAARNGHLAVVKFLHQNRREGHLATAKKLAVLNGRAKCVEYLHAVDAGAPAAAPVVSVAWRKVRDHEDQSASAAQSTAVIERSQD